MSTRSYWREAIVNEFGFQIGQRIVDFLDGETYPAVEELGSTREFRRLVAAGWPDGTHQHSETQMARRCGVSRRTICRWLRKLRQAAPSTET